jgi:hypothetical protein
LKTKEKKMLNAKNVPMNGGGGKKRPPVLEPGGYPARLVQVILLGLQKQRPYQGQEKPPALEMYLTYELLDEFLKDEDDNDIEDKPRWISETLPFYNLDVERAKSTQRYYALDPNEEAGGDWGELLGAPCVVNIINAEGKGKNAGRMYENIDSIATIRPKEAAKAPALVNPTKVFDFYNPDVEVFKALPEWLQTKIKEAVDFEGSDLEAALEQAPAPKKEEKPAKKKPVKAVDPEEDDGEEW